MKTLIKRALLVLATPWVSTAAQAAAVGNLAAPAQVTDIYTYSEYGGGDVIFKIATSVTGCEAGFWLRPSDGGFQRNVALLMSAQLARRAITLQAADDLLWPGSTGKFCHVILIAMQ
jgi:hypothetical protein